MAELMNNENTQINNDEASPIIVTNISVRIYELYGLGIIYNN